MEETCPLAFVLESLGERGEAEYVPMLRDRV